ncbi:hypothetical protein BHE74_00047989 [Ensete ventricosum]|nr:hypothetical protein BHE74_00047989 [Ensete ventricosum]
MVLLTLRIFLKKPCRKKGFRPTQTSSASEESRRIFKPSNIKTSWQESTTVGGKLVMNWEGPTEHLRKIEMELIAWKPWKEVSW